MATGWTYQQVKESAIKEFDAWLQEGFSGHIHAEDQIAKIAEEEVPISNRDRISIILSDESLFVREVDADMFGTRVDVAMVAFHVIRETLTEDLTAYWIEHRYDY